jgi:transposase-like protein
MTRPNCPECENTMVRAANPLHRIFGDIRAFECSQCGYTLLLKYPFEPMPSGQSIGLQRLDVAK